MYNEKKVWMRRNTNGGFFLFLNHGYAMDYNKMGAQWLDYRSEELQETRILFYPVNGEDHLEGEFAYAIQEGDNMTSWFMTEDEARDGAKQLQIQNGFLREALILGDKREPLPDVFQVEWEANTKGEGFVTKLNAHPEWDGMYASEKIFFPDRSFVEVCEGPALVSISHEKDSYGFLNGHMVSFEETSPTLEELINMDHYHGEDATLEDVTEHLTMIDHPYRGKYFTCQGDFYFVKVDGEITLQNLPSSVNDSEFQVWSKPTSQVRFENCFGEDSQTVLDMFQDSKWFTQQEKLMVRDPWYQINEFPKGVKISGDLAQLLDDAYAADLLQCYQLGGTAIRVLTLNHNQLGRFDQFSDEEIETMAKFMSQVNQNTDEEIRRQASKGKLQLVRNPWVA